MAAEKLGTRRRIDGGAGGLGCHNSDWRKRRGLRMIEGYGRVEDDEGRLPVGLHVPIGDGRRRKRSWSSGVVLLRSAERERRGRGRKWVGVCVGWAYL